MTFYLSTISPKYRNSKEIGRIRIRFFRKPDPFNINSDPQLWQRPHSGLWPDIRLILTAFLSRLYILESKLLFSVEHLCLLPAPANIHICFLNLFKLLLSRFYSLQVCSSDKTVVSRKEKIKGNLLDLGWQKMVLNLLPAQAFLKRKPHIREPAKKLYFFSGPATKAPLPRT